LAEDIAFRVLAAGNAPNFRTISDFRKIHLRTLESLFEQVLKIALEAGAMKLGRVALDGTKVKANASKHKAMSYDRMQEKERQTGARYGSYWREPRRPIPRKTPCTGPTSEATSGPKSCSVGRPG
jgi:hypothetical protein